MADWRGLFSEALEAHRADPASRFVPLASVRPDGGPAVRWMVFRGIDGDERLEFVTNAASAKIAEFSVRPEAEAAFYFRDSREQFRILGTVECLGSDAVDDGRLRVWRAMSPDARRLFDYTGDAPPPSFVLLRLAPLRVAYLDLKPWPHRELFFPA